MKSAPSEWRQFSAVLLALLSPLAVLAQEEFAEDAPPPRPRTKGVSVTFLPPPLEGTLSVGIYTIDGKLKRTLAREASDDRFTAGLNGFIIAWDGAGDDGMPLPAGRYFVRGYAVGSLQIEGVAFHGNDWLGAEDAPRVAALREIEVQGRTLKVSAAGTNGESIVVQIDLDNSAETFAPAPVDAVPESALSAEVIGAGGSRWSIDQADGAKIVRQYSASDEPLRELEISPEDPQPFAMAATERDEIFFLEKNEREERLRGLRLKETKSAADGTTVSEWEVFLSKSIASQKDFATASARVSRVKAPAAEENIRVALMPNELLQVAPNAVQVEVAVDEKGSFLRTTDGLPLRRVTTTPHLKWAALVGESDGSITLFQSDGAVVEEFRLRQLRQMMAFDAGDYEWTGAK